MGKITPSSIEEVKQIDIVDIISNSIEVKKSGANFTALCPFHSEKTPSLVISPTKRIYHCFSCNVGGDSIKFVQEFNKLSFVESVEKIANDFGVDLQYEQGRDTSIDKRLIDVNENFLFFIKKNLRASDREYLYSRGFTDETIELFGIGYTPRGSDDIVSFFSGFFIPIPLVVEAGVLGNFKNKIYSPFGSRITFPIYDTFGKLKGFSGRSLSKEAKQKYKNTRETKIFSKAKLLFGLNLSRQFAIQKKWLILFEGQFDNMLVYQAGIKNVVATQGTALTKSHVKQIKRLGVKVFLAYDGDKAGVASSLKSAVLLAENGIDGGVVTIPAGEDPADMVSTNRVDELKYLLKEGTKRKLIPYILNSIAKAHNLNDPYSKKDGVQEAQRFLGKLDSVIGGHYRTLLKQIFNVDISIQTPMPLPIPLDLNPLIPRATLEDNILYTLIKEPFFVDSYGEYIEVDAFIKKIIEINFDGLESSLALLEGILFLEENVLLLSLKQMKKRYLRSKISLSDMQQGMSLSKQILELGV